MNICYLKGILLSALYLRDDDNVKNIRLHCVQQKTHLVNYLITQLPDFIDKIMHFQLSTEIHHVSYTLLLV